MYKLLKELNAMQSLPAIEDKSDQEELDMDASDAGIEVFRIDDPETEEDDGGCGCDGGGDEEQSGDPVEDAVSMFRDWLTQNVEFIDDSNSDVEEDEEQDELEPGGIESEVTEPTDDSMEDNQPEGELGSGPDELEEPNRQGMIRTVPGAHLVYKRKTPDGFYDELWFFNVGKQTKHDEMVVRKAILAGTDIPETSTKSEDGNQRYELWTAGNGQLLKIQGLPN